MTTSLNSLETENYFDTNIEIIGGVVKAYYSCERPDGEHYQNIQDIFKYCGLKYEESKASTDFKLDELQANYLGDYVLFHYYLKKFGSEKLFELLKTFTLPKPTFVKRFKRFCNIILKIYLDWFYENNKHDWKKIVKFFEELPASKTFDGNHDYIYNDKHNCDTINKSKILELTSSQSDLSEYTSLKKLNFFGTEITSISNTVEHISFYNPQIKEIPKELIHLEYIDCSHTKITEIPKEFVKLTELYFDCTKISEIPRELIKLKILNCSRSNVKEIPKELIHLKCIECYINFITEIPRELICLEYIDCSRTSISKIPKELINLTKLYCSHTQISELPKELINLTKLRCSFTKITEIPKELIYLSNHELYKYNYCNIL